MTICGWYSRGNDGVTIPTEILVHNNKVAKISSGEYINSTVPEGMYILREVVKQQIFCLIISNR